MKNSLNFANTCLKVVDTRRIVFHVTHVTRRIYMLFIAKALLILATDKQSRRIMKPSNAVTIRVSFWFLCSEPNVLATPN
jgi:hypothetical protein